MKFKSELEAMITLAYIEGGYFVEQASGRFIFKFLENKELQNALLSELYNKNKAPTPFSYNLATLPLCPWKENPYPLIQGITLVG